MNEKSTKGWQTWPQLTSIQLKVSSPRSGFWKTSIKDSNETQVKRSGDLCLNEVFLS